MTCFKRYRRLRSRAAVRELAASPWRRTRGDTSSSRGRCTARVTPRCGRSAIVRALRRPSSIPVTGHGHDAFALTMTLALGIKAPLNFSAFSAPLAVCFSRRVPGSRSAWTTCAGRYHPERHAATSSTCRSLRRREDRGACTPSGHLVHLSPVLVHTVHHREHERRRPADQDDAREALDPCEHPPARAEDDVTEADRRVAGDGEVDRLLQRRQLALPPEHAGPESDLDQMEEDDEHEDAEEEPDAPNHVRGFEDLTDPGNPVDHRQRS